MKIALVNLRPPARENVAQLWPGGLLSLASWLNAKSGHRAVIIDEPDPLPQLMADDYGVIGISAMTIGYERACKLVHQLRRARVRAKIILGGVHISTLPASLRWGVDHAFLGEAEDTLIDYLDGQYSHSRLIPAKYRVDLDQYPALDYGLIKPDYFKPRWLNLWEEMGVNGSVLTSRGCPYRCAFCSTSHFWDGVRYYSIPWVVNEIKTLVSLGATVISFEDDLFTINRKRLRKLTEALEAEGVLDHVKCVGYSKANVIDNDICELLLRLKFKFVNFGFESGNERVLAYLKCGTATVAQNERAVELCRKHGLRVIGSLIFCTPRETFKEQWDSVRFATRTAWRAADSLWCIPLTPYPGTPVWDYQKARGLVRDDMDFDRLSMWDDHWKDIPWVVRFAFFLIKAFMKVRRTVRYANWHDLWNLSVSRLTRGR